MRESLALAQNHLSCRLPPHHLTSWPLLRLLDPTRPDTYVLVNFLIQPDPTRGSAHSPCNSDLDYTKAYFQHYHSECIRTPFSKDNFEYISGEWAGEGHWLVTPRSAPSRDNQCQSAATATRFQMCQVASPHRRQPRRGCRGRIPTNNLVGGDISRNVPTNIRVAM